MFAIFPVSSARTPAWLPWELLNGPVLHTGHPNMIKAAEPYRNLSPSLDGT
jgi:hypothetical protein